jgi:hypothetical protein
MIPNHHRQLRIPWAAPLPRIPNHIAPFSKQSERRRSRLYGSERFVEIRKLQQDSLILITRLRFGALKNHTCSSSDNFSMSTSWRNSSSLSSSSLPVLSMVRYLQHARKGDFSVNKFGKVMVDVSQLSTNILLQQQQLPRNIHRPWMDFCGAAAKSLSHSMLRVNSE